MPRCQRTFRKLPAGKPLTRFGTMRWVCPHCADRETYETLSDGDLLRFAETALSSALNDFGPPDDAKRPILLLRGLFPECVRELSDKRYDIYLQTGSDSLQERLQIAHEIFHRVCSQGRVFHWTHEMLACAFSVRVLETCGFGDYARSVCDYFNKQSAALSVLDMQTALLFAGVSAYPPGFYGRAFVTGQALNKIVGWPALCRLSRFNLTPTNPVPDVVGWSAAFSPEQKREINTLLGITKL